MEDQTPFHSLVVGHCDFNAEEFLVGDHELEIEEGLDKIELGVSGIGGEAGLGVVV